MARSVLSGQEWMLAYTVMNGVLILPLLPLWITSYFVIKRKKDPARFGFLWLKAALGFMFLAMLLKTIAYIIGLLLNTDAINYNSDQLYKYAEITNRLSDWGFVLGEFAALFTFLTILDVACGILTCWDGRHESRRAVRWSAYAFFAVQSILLLVRFGGQEAYLTAYYNCRSNRSSRCTLPNAAFQLSLSKIIAAYFIIFWIATTVLLGFVITVFVRGRKGIEHRKAATLALVAGCLFWAQTLWNMIATAVWNLAHRLSPDTWDYILDAIFGSWFPFVALVLLFVIGRKKAGGLWSTVQNFTSKEQYYQSHGQPVGGNQRPYDI